MAGGNGAEDKGWEYGISLIIKRFDKFLIKNHSFKKWTYR